MRCVQCPRDSSQERITIRNGYKDGNLGRGVERARYRTCAWVRSRSAFHFLKERERSGRHRSGKNGQRNGTFIVLCLGFLGINGTTLPLPISMLTRLETNRRLLLILRGRRINELRGGNDICTIALHSALLRTVRLTGRVVLSFPFVRNHHIMNGKANHGIKSRLLIVRLIREGTVANLAMIFGAFSVNGCPQVRFRLSIPYHVHLAKFMMLILGVSAYRATFKGSVEPRTRHRCHGSYHECRVEARRALRARSHERRNGGLQILHRFKDGRSCNSGCGRQARRVNGMKSRIRVVVGSGDVPQHFVERRTIRLLIRIRRRHGKSGRYSNGSVYARRLLGGMPIRPLRRFASQRLCVLPCPPIRFSRGLISAHFAVVNFRMTGSPTVVYLHTSPTDRE